MQEISPAPPTTLSARAALAAELEACGAEGRPRVAVVHGPRGWGKREILEEALRTIQARGVPACSIDFGLCVTNPDEFATAFVAACLEVASRTIGRPGAPAGEAAPLVRPAGVPTPGARLRALAASRFLQDLPTTHPIVADLMAELGRHRGRSEVVFGLATDVPHAVAADLGRPLCLIAHALDEIGRLAHFPGLERVLRTFASGLARSETVRILGSTSPAGRPRDLHEALRVTMPDQFRVRIPPPFAPGEAPSPLGEDERAAETARMLLAITGGRPLTCGILASRLAAGLTLDQALAHEMEPGAGRLNLELRFDYHLLIERTRGHAASRAILNVLAREEGLDLTGIASRLRRSAGSTLDYLRWLLEIDLLRREGRRYRFADPLMRLYVLLHEVAERPCDAAGRRGGIERFLATFHDEPVPLRPLGRPRGRRSLPVDESLQRRREPPTDAQPPSPAPPRREDTLIEID